MAAMGVIPVTAFNKYAAALCGNTAQSRSFLGEVCSLRPVSRETLIKQKSGREWLNIDVPAALIISDYLFHNFSATMDSRGRCLSHNGYTMACICLMV